MSMNKQTTYLPAASTDLAFTATPQNITPPDDVYVVRLLSDQNCRVTWLKSGTITLVAGIPEYFQCHPRDAISVVRQTTDGNLNVGWMTN